MSVCQYGHPFSGRYCVTCKDHKRAAKRVEPVRTKAKGEPPALVVDDAWRSDAACRYPPHGVYADDWFAQRQALADQQRLALALAICEGCPVQAQCLAYALETRQPWGVWGGKTADERANEHRRPTVKPAR